MTEQEQFVADLTETVDLIDATPRQREVYKASLRYAISHAVRKAAQRKQGLLVINPMPIVLTGNV